VQAFLLERDDDDPNDDRRVEGPVDSIAQPDLTILGQTVIVNGATQYRGLADETLTSTEFFGLVAAGDVVAVKFAVGSGNPILARELEIEFLVP
jgi:Domain of unknown function (DUF5666)